MLYIGWDIGIKNLAYCIIEYKNGKQTIIEFDIINLIEDLIPVTNKCSLTHKNGNAILKHYINQINRII